MVSQWFLIVCSTFGKVLHMEQFLKKKSSVVQFFMGSSHFQIDSVPFGENLVGHLG